MKCPVCKRIMHESPKDYIDHHFWHPKRKFKKNFTIRVHTKCERDYHAYYFRSCYKQDKPCGRCRFPAICCYRKTPEG